MWKEKRERDRERERERERWGVCKTFTRIFENIETACFAKKGAFWVVVVLGGPWRSGGPAKGGSEKKASGVQRVVFRLKFSQSKKKLDL